MEKPATGSPKAATIKLDEPIARGDSEISELTLRRPDAGTLRGLSMAELLKMDAAAVAELLPRISSPPLIREEIDALAPSDLFACAVEISSFFMTRDERAAAFPTT